MAEANLESSGTSTLELRKKAPLQMLDWVLNTSLNCLVVISIYNFTLSLLYLSKLEI